MVVGVSLCSDSCVVFVLQYNKIVMSPTLLLELLQALAACLKPLLEYYIIMPSFASGGNI